MGRWRRIVNLYQDLRISLVVLGRELREEPERALRCALQHQQLISEFVRSLQRLEVEARACG